MHKGLKGVIRQVDFMFWLLNKNDQFSHFTVSLNKELDKVRIFCKAHLHFVFCLLNLQLLSVGDKIWNSVDKKCGGQNFFFHMLKTLVPSDEIEFYTHLFDKSLAYQQLVANYISSKLSEDDCIILYL